MDNSNYRLRIRWLCECNLKIFSLFGVKNAFNSMFYGIVVYIYSFDNIKHKLPHIHVKYQGEFAVVTIPDCNILEGNLPNKKFDLLRAWVHIHEEELMANWELSINGETPYKIEPLK
jgi:hypothetical protein